MTPEERQLLNSLADRVKSVPPQRKDPEADQFVRQLTQQVPDASYILAQTVIMQDFALRNAQKQIEDLQRQLNEGSQPQQQSGSFLGGLFGGGGQAPQPSPQSSGSVPRVNPWDRQAPEQGAQGYAPPNAPPGYQGGPSMQPSQTGDFLRNAASTATGVAGGALLFQGISSLFSGHHGSLFGSGLSGLTPRESLSEKTVADPGAGILGGGAAAGSHPADRESTGADRDSVHDANNDNDNDNDDDDDDDDDAGGDDSTFA
jgi:uncharacterized protein